MNGVPRLYLQAYHDEYCWRLANGNRNGMYDFFSNNQSKAIRDCFNHFQNANDILDTRRKSNILNVSADVQLYFGTYANEEVLTVGFR